MNNIDNGLIQNGPSDLSHQSKFMELTENINPHQGLIFHSIMGNITKSDDPNVITDGIVPYKSAHLEGAKSESSTGWTLYSVNTTSRIRTTSYFTRAFS